MLLPSSLLSFPQCHHFPSICLHSAQSSEMSPTHPQVFLWSLVFISLCIPVLPAVLLLEWLCTLLASIYYESSNIGPLLSTVWHKIYQLWIWFRSGGHPNILVSPEVENCRPGFRKSWSFTTIVFIKPQNSSCFFPFIKPGQQLQNFGILVFLCLDAHIEVNATMNSKLSVLTKDHVMK